MCTPCELTRVAEECESNNPFQEARHRAIIRLGELVSGWAAAEALTVLSRFDEGTDHLGLLGALLRLRIVTHVFARLTDRVEFRQPEIVAGEIIIGRIVGITSQITKVLHEHKRIVIELVKDRSAFNHTLQSGRTTRGVTAAIS